MDEQSTFGVKVAAAGQMALARVDGPLDRESAPPFLAAVTPLATAGGRLVVDLRRAEYLDSAGVRALLHLRGQVEAAHGELRLVVLPGSRILRTLSLLQLQDRFRIYHHAVDAWTRHAA